jgi:CRISPR system CASCADE complex protein casA
VPVCSSFDGELTSKEKGVRVVELEEPQYNLNSEYWVPVLLSSGKKTEVSLRDLFVGSYDIQAIDTGDPLQDTAILGVALVILARATLRNNEIENFGGSPNWIHQMREPDADNLSGVLQYLEEFNDRFWLLGGDRPFMQVYDLHTAKGVTKPVSRLLLDSESEHYSMRAEKTLKSLSYAEAARRLVTIQAYDYSGIKSGAVGDPRVRGGRGYPLGVGWYGTTGKVIIHGANLMETLLYNIEYAQLTEESLDYDKPVWERDKPDTAAPRAYTGGPAAQYKDQPVPASGMCEILTWQSRRVRLHHDGERVTSVLISNGDKWFDRNTYADPLTGYRYSKNQSSKTEQVWMPQAHSAERTLWRGADALLTRLTPESEKQNKPAPVIRQLGLGRHFPTDAEVKVQLVGVEYGNQNAVIENVISDSMTIELSLLADEGLSVSHMVRESIRATMDAAIALGQFAGQLLQAAGREYEFRADATEALLNRMEDAFRLWLADQRATEDITEKKKEWQRHVHAVIKHEADLLKDNAGPKAMVGTFGKDSSGNDVLYNVARAERLLFRQLLKIIPLAYQDSASRSNREEPYE